MTEPYTKTQNQVASRLKVLPGAITSQNQFSMVGLIEQQHTNVVRDLRVSSAKQAELQRARSKMVPDQPRALWQDLEEQTRMQYMELLTVISAPTDFTEVSGQQINTVFQQVLRALTTLFDENDISAPAQTGAHERSSQQGS
jgi:hypothetical protein